MSNRKDFKPSQKAIHPKVKEERIVLLDADTLTFWASYRGYDELGVKREPFKEEEFYIAEGILTDNLLKIYNSIEEHYKITDTFICIKGDNNFRYSIYPDYKSKRPPSPPIIGHLHKYIIDCHNGVEAPSGEADDMVYTLCNKLGKDKCIIVSVDRDLLQIEGLHYNYQKLEWVRVSDEDARHHIATKVLCGDQGDGVNLSPKIGVAYANKVLEPGMTNYQYIKNIYIGYLKAWKGDVKLAKKNMKLAYQLLKLHNI